MAIHGSKEWRAGAYRDLIYRKERKMWRSWLFNTMACVYGKDIARTWLREATDDELQRFVDNYAKACGEQQEEQEYAEALETIERYEKKNKGG